MHFALWPHPADAWDVVLASALHAEQTGWDAVYFADHLMPAGPPCTGGPIYECWTMLSAVAARTTRVRIGSLVSCASYRHPSMLAHMAATVDQISGGRLVLGLGAGWQENEHRAYGFDFGGARERFDRLEETCEILRGLLCQERTTFAGSYYSVVDAPLDPKPRQARLPIVVGGGGPRTVRLVARYADGWNMWGLPHHCEAMRPALAEQCAAAGRDITTVVRSAQAILAQRQDLAALGGADGSCPTLPADTPAEIRDAMMAYREAGIDEFVVPVFHLPRWGARKDFMDMFLESVVSLRS